MLRLKIYIHLLDEHVQILRKVGGEACKNLSVSLNRTEACMLMFFQRKTIFLGVVYYACYRWVHVGIVPLDFRIRRIRLPELGR
jgi:hypothetical protein